MADYTRRERTARWVEYVLPNPTNAAELAKAVSAATADLSDRTISDDTITISADDEQIIVSYEVTR